MPFTFEIIPMHTAFDLKNISGQTEAEALRRLDAEGFNEISAAQQRGLVRIVLEVAREPMFLLLVGCGLLYLLTGELYDALMLLGFVLIVMGITVIQERRTERVLEALRDLSSPRALVIRDGRRRRIPGREVVRGDIILLVEGDRVPADAILRQAISLSADESLLTGESAPVRKSATEQKIDLLKPGGDDLPFVFAGTLVTAGQGLAEILTTGMRTEMGKIGKALQKVTPEDTLLQKETGQLVRNLAVIGLLLCLLVILAYGFTRGNTPQAWLQGLLNGITLAMALLPEEFPVVLTIFLALGAWRISRNRVLTRRMPAVETLGAATVLCTDKTGTLTLNQMSVRQLFVDGELFDAHAAHPTSLSERFHPLLEYGILASKRDPFDPMEKALNELGAKFLAHTEHLHQNWNLIREYPLSPHLLALSHVWKSPDGSIFEIAAKGAPEAIADLCHLSTLQRTELAGCAADMAAAGLRVLGVAQAYFRKSDLPADQHDFRFKFLGLIGLADPVRPTVPAAIRECYTAGIRVVMITGDYPGTAKSIAQQIGLRSPEQCITGSELDAMSDAELEQRIGATSIFARVVPEQKLRIVKALKACGEIVAMTGDGVNDAPALKSAHIGIAMGGRGTDVAREASALVVLDDDFSSIVAAVRLGRRIFDNIKKAVAYIFAVHVPIAGIAVIPMFFHDWPPLLLPVHVAFLELIIDPACSIIFEAENAEPDVMQRPPRNSKNRLFSRSIILLGLFQGVCVLAAISALLAASTALGHADANSRRTLAFIALVVANLWLILTNRSRNRTIFSMFREPNHALWWVVGGAMTAMALLLNVPFLRELFHFAPLHPVDILLSIAAGIASIVLFELLKLAPCLPGKPATGR